MQFKFSSRVPLSSYIKYTGLNKIGWVEDLLQSTEVILVMPPEPMSSSVISSSTKSTIYLQKGLLLIPSNIVVRTKNLFLTTQPFYIYTQNTYLMRSWWWDFSFSLLLTAAHSVLSSTSPDRIHSSPKSSPYQHKKNGDFFSIQMLQWEVERNGSQKTPYFITKLYGQLNYIVMVQGNSCSTL